MNNHCLELPKIDVGKRAVISGRTGSGKTTLACWLLKRSPLNWFILNPKWTAGYKSLPGVNVIEGFNIRKIDRSIQQNKFTLINPKKGENNDAELMDSIIGYYHERFENIGFCADELYTLHKAGQAGDGLIGWLTRGRELGQSFVGCTQRPAWISRFVFSEADYIATKALNLKDDRKRVFEMTGHEVLLESIPPPSWYWYNVADDRLCRYGGVPLK